jgi:hypothetical protein
MVPVTSPRAIRPPFAPGALARRVTVSPSSRNVRSRPSQANGSWPPHDSSRKEPRCSRAAPLTVPEANRSPGRTDAPLTVRWASIWAGDQYIAAYGGRLTVSPLSTTSKSMS